MVALRGMSCRSGSTLTSTPKKTIKTTFPADFSVLELSTEGNDLCFPLRALRFGPMSAVINLSRISGH